MSRPVFSFRPNLKNPEHEKAWRLLMEVPAGQRNQYLVDVILEKEERETLWSRSKGGEAYGQRKYGIVGSAWVLHAFDMDSLVGIVNSFLSNFGVCCV